METKKDKKPKARRHPMYELWRGLKRRCREKGHKDYPWYGARGVDYDDRWDDFHIFLVEVGPRPSKNHSLDRIDNNKGYFKENVRWATAKEQANNKRTKDTCFRGHPWTEESMQIVNIGKGKKARRCMICYVPIQEKYRRENRELINKKQVERYHKRRQKLKGAV